MYPTPNQLCLALTSCAQDDADVTIVASNCASAVDHHANAMQIAPTHAVADTGAKSIFVMAGAPANNILVAKKPIHISLPDGKKILSTHICDVDIPGLPHKQIGHIVPDMKMASLLDICILCKAGCEVIFDNEKCQVNFKGNTILTWYKYHKQPLDPTHSECRGEAVDHPRIHLVASKQTLSQPGPCKGHAPQPPFEHMPTLALFSYHRTTKANAVKFMHQSLCNPPITSLLNAINAGFLRGAPHLNAKSVQKYLTPSPATSKGHMKHPCKSLQSTTPKPTRQSFPCPPSNDHPFMPGLIPDDSDEEDDDGPWPAFIDNINDESIANVFCFGTFADKNTGVVYNDCTGNFLFMSLDGSVCFFVMYHYKTNAIFAMPIPGLDTENILNAYKKNFEYLIRKGYTPKINVMDNQATKAIKSYLTPQQCRLQLVEPDNHRVNAAERAIQTFKNLFIVPSAPLMWTFPSNFGTSLPPKCKTPSTSSDALKSTQPNRCLKYSKDCTTGIDTPWHHLVPRQQSVKMPTQGHRGHPMASMHGSLGR